MCASSHPSLQQPNQAELKRLSVHLPEPGLPFTHLYYACCNRGPHLEVIWSLTNGRRNAKEYQGLPAEVGCSWAQQIGDKPAVLESTAVN